MTSINHTHLNALKYVRNTDGGATRANFLEDHEPVGEPLWRDLVSLNLIYVHEARVYLTDEGKRLIGAA